MKRILVGVDGSDASLDGARTALDLGARLGAEVTFLYVAPVVMQSGDVPFASLDEIEAQELKRGKNVLDQVAAALDNPKAERVVRIGAPAETLTEMAEQEAFDLVVVGSTGKGAVKRLLVGSTADRVVHLCHKAVLVVRAGQPARESK